MIQAPLESGVPNDEIDITECMKYYDIEFIETVKSVKVVHQSISRLFVR